MKVLKKINNNVALCLDDNGNELVAFGNGIGFSKTPYDLADLSKIKRTYYGVNKKYIGLVNEIPQNIFDLSAQIVDMAIATITANLNPNIVFTLADHINFSIERYKKNLKIPMPDLNNLNYLYPKEFEIGQLGVKLINKKLNVQLNHDEIVGIALHIINAEAEQAKNSLNNSENRIISESLKIIEKFYGIKISKKGFNYNRFVEHLQFLIKRLESGEKSQSNNFQILEDLKRQFPNTYICAIKVKEKIEKITAKNLSNEEIVYLMLHINRLLNRVSNE
ncbi:MAG: PRD domain-containing protein [Lactobacillus crispatus]|nr:PRD domain-containing protein [Lactobacillus crispatus]